MASEVASEFGCHVVLKGARTVISTPAGEVFINPTGNPGMASGGMGDVLTGMMGGFVCQGLDLKDAARLATYLHGLAGDRAASRIDARLTGAAAGRQSSAVASSSHVAKVVA